MTDTIESLRSTIEALRRERDEARALAERMKLEAQAHASEAKAANSTVYEIYQVLSGGKGEPGNWHGAEPAREYVARAEAAEREIAIVKEGGWRPIETAPRDGTPFLGWIGPRLRPDRGAAEVINWYAPWGVWMRRREDPVVDTYERYGIGAKAATHWRPLPPVPALDGDQE